MAEPSKSYAEEPSDKQVEAAASEPVPAPRSPDTPPEIPPLRIQVDGRETTAEPRIVGDNGVPAPAVRRRRQRKTLKRAAAPSTEMIFNFAPPNAGLAAPPHHPHPYRPVGRLSRLFPSSGQEPSIGLSLRLRPGSAYYRPVRPSTTVEPQPQAAASAPPPPVIPPTETPTPEPTPEPPPQPQGQNRLALFLGVLAIVALLLWIVSGAPPIGSALQERFSHLLPGRPTAPSTASPDNLYGYTITPPIVDGVPFTRLETTGDCEGTMFTPDPSRARSGATVYPFLQVCFLGLDTGNPPNDVNGQLQARADQVEIDVLSEAREGLTRYTEIGQDRIPGQEVYIRGQDRETGKEIEWYEATVQYGDRFYAIEAADEVSNWDEIWPAFSDAIATLQFADGVVIPPNAPIVIP